jgi:hypothetical protein
MGIAWVLIVMLLLAAVSVVGILQPQDYDE